MWRCGYLVDLRVALGDVVAKVDHLVDQLDAVHWRQRVSQLLELSQIREHHSRTRELLRKDHRY